MTGCNYITVVGDPPLQTAFWGILPNMLSFGGPIAPPKANWTICLPMFIWRTIGRQFGGRDPMAFWGCATSAKALWLTDTQLCLADMNSMHQWWIAAKPPQTPLADRTSSHPPDATGRQNPQALADEDPNCGCTLWWTTHSTSRRPLQARGTQNHAQYAYAALMHDQYVPNKIRIY
jgi:hypothetical protein